MNLTLKKQEAGLYAATTPEGWEVRVFKCYAPSSESAVYAANGQSLSHYWAWTIDDENDRTLEASGGEYDSTFAECKESAAAGYKWAQKDAAK